MANAERGVGMIGFAGEIDTEFFITKSLLLIASPLSKAMSLICRFKSKVSIGA